MAKARCSGRRDDEVRVEYDPDRVEFGSRCTGGPADESGSRSDVSIRHDGIATPLFGRGPGRVPLVIRSSSGRGSSRVRTGLEARWEVRVEFGQVWV